MTQNTSMQRTAEIARRLATLGETEKALNAYELLIHQAEEQEPQLALEGALYIFQNGGDYKIAYACFCKLYNAGHFREDLYPLMYGGFYLPNIKQLKTRYEKNCKLLAKYPYLFRKDFPKFEELPLLFFPYDDHGYTVYDPSQDQFGPYTDYSHPVVSRNFFADLEKPVLAADVFSQYELEYLNDNVRKSEWVAKENHIYLHYTDWAVFCAHLQVLNLHHLLKEKKFVFLIDEEIAQYPIDFKARFGIDYSQYEVKALDSTEFHRLIWHTQLAAHNGGDFFNEIFDNHPNLITVHSTMLETLSQTMEQLRTCLRDSIDPTEMEWGIGSAEVFREILPQLTRPSAQTDHALFMTILLASTVTTHLDHSQRIVPAIFFQPHFPNIYYSLVPYSNGVATLHSDEYEAIQNSPVFKVFKYIKTFTPIRRPTSSCGASLRFMVKNAGTLNENGAVKAVSDLLSERLLNQSFRIDYQDRLFKDCVMVRFEDAKLNPKATFRALAAFLDLPYTESMTYCSVYGHRNAASGDGTDIGFSTAALYRTYDEFFGDAERYVTEYFLQDIYEYCGYGLQYYDGEPMDMERMESFWDRFTVLDGHIRASFETFLKLAGQKALDNDPTLLEKGFTLDDLQTEKSLAQQMATITNNRRRIAEILLKKPRLVNKNGQPLHMMPLLKLDPELLEQPLYH